MNTFGWDQMAYWWDEKQGDVRVPDNIVSTRAYHRSLSWYFRTLRASGLVVAALEEPEPTEEFLNDEQAPWIAEIPLHCVIEAWKVRGVL